VFALVLLTVDIPPIAYTLSVADEDDNVEIVLRIVVYRPVVVLAIIGSNSTWLDSTRLDTFDFVEPVEPVEQVETSVSSETSRVFPTWRTTNDLVQV